MTLTSIDNLHTLDWWWWSWLLDLLIGWHSLALNFLGLLDGLLWLIMTWPTLLTCAIDTLDHLTWPNIWTVMDDLVLPLKKYDLDLFDRFTLTSWPTCLKICPTYSKALTNLKVEFDLRYMEDDHDDLDLLEWWPWIAFDDLAMVDR